MASPCNEHSQEDSCVLLERLVELDVMWFIVSGILVWNPYWEIMSVDQI